MATLNPDDAEFTCKNPDCPKGIFEWKTILGHIVRAKKCKIFYSEAEINAIRENSDQMQKRNKAQKRKISDTKQVNPEPTTSTSGIKGKKIEKNKTRCKICKKFFVVLLLHLDKSDVCKIQYGKQFDKLKTSKNNEKKEYQKVYNKEYQINNRVVNDKEIKEQRANYRSQNRELISQRNAQFYCKNQEKIKEKQRYQYSINKNEINERRKRKKLEERIKAFKQDIIHSPNYSCFSCKRSLFKNSVKILKAADIKALLAKLNKDFLKKVDLDHFQDDSLIFCHNCFKLIKSSKIPKIHVSNGLKLDKVPEELKLGDLEQQLIARSLLFMKVKKLPGVNRMKAMFDQVVSVPIEEDDISKTISELPRHPDDAKIVAVQLKRKLEYSNTHLAEYIRPAKCIKAVERLKELGNPFYQNIKVNNNFMFQDEDDDDMDNFLDDVMDDFENQPNFENTEENDGILDAVKQFQSK